MRVLYVTGEYPPLQGGVGDCTHEIARATAAQGVEVHVLTTLPKGQEAGWTLEDGTITVHRLVPKWTWSMFPLLDHVLKTARPDVLHIQYQTAAYGMHPAVNLAPRLVRRQSAGRGDGARGVRTVSTFHDLRLPYLFPKAGPARTWVTYELARSSDAAIATNPADWGQLAAKLGRAPDLIPIGSNIAPTPPAAFDRTGWRTRLGVAPDELLLSYFGFLNDSKGGLDLLRALAEVNRRGVAARLLMVGGQVGSSDPTNENYLERVKELAGELGISTRVLWTGYTAAEEVSANLLASDLCVLPYRDGASFRRGSLMAALAHGLPVLTTTPDAAMTGQGMQAGMEALADFPVLRDGKNVAVAPAANPEALADAIVRLAAAPDLRLALGAAARETAKYFSWDRIAAHHLALYRRLMGL